MAQEASQLDTDAVALSQSLHLESVQLKDFKSYRGHVKVGPLHPGINVIIGPNGASCQHSAITIALARLISPLVHPSGCGKSCLVEGICFALGIGSTSLRAQSLQSLVHQGLDHGNASVVLQLSSRDENVPHTLTLQRRLIGSKRSEFCLQECHCCSPRAKAPWPCAQCAVLSNVKRPTLRDTVLRVLHLDIDSPERFVVQQAGVLAIAQRSPCDLLHFLESLVGTDHLRLKLEETLANAAALR